MITKLFAIGILLLVCLFIVVARATYLKLSTSNFIQQIKDEFHAEMKRRGYEK